MGGCCSRDPDSKTSWSPSEANNASTTSTIVAQPTNDRTAAGVFTNTTVMPVGGAYGENSEVITTIVKTTTVTETVTNSND